MPSCASHVLHHLRTAHDERVRCSDGFAIHQQAHPVAHDLLAQAVSQARPDPAYRVWIEGIEMHRAVGTSSRVIAPVAGLDDLAWFARRHGRPIPDRVIVGPVAPVCSMITLVLGRIRGGSAWSLHTAFVDSPAERFPTRLSHQVELQYWGQHALIWSGAMFQEAPFQTTWRRVIDRTWRPDLGKGRPAVTHGVQIP